MQHRLLISTFPLAHTHAHTPTHTQTHSCIHSILHKPVLTFCPSALEQPAGCLRSRSSHHPVPEAADGTVSECCKGLRTALTSTDNKFPSETRVDMKCTCCFKMIHCAKAKTNYSLDNVSRQNKTICSCVFCLRFCRL